MRDSARVVRYVPVFTLVPVSTAQVWFGFRMSRGMAYSMADTPHEAIATKCLIAGQHLVGRAYSARLNESLLHSTWCSAMRMIDQST